MAGLKIRVFKGRDESPNTTITIPLAVLRVASRFVPRQVATLLQENGIELEQIAALAHQEDLHGLLVEIEKHKRDQKITISIE